MAGAGVARAQVKHNDYTLLNTSLGSSAPKIISIDEASQYGASLSGPGLGTDSGWTGRTPDINQTISDQKVIMGQFNTTYSPLNGHMSSDPLWNEVFNGGDTRQPDMFHQTDTRRPLMDSALQKNSSLNDYTAPDQWERPGGVSKYSDAYTFHVQDSGNPVDEIGKELSMQDINRYQFHSSNSSEPGLPITRAAGDSQEPTFDGAPTDIPSLFQFNNDKANTVSQVHSGGPVAPNLITPQGTFKYNPQGPTPFTPTPLGDGRSNNSVSPPVSLGHGPPASQTQVQSQPRAPDLINEANELHAPPRDGVNTKVELGTRHIWEQYQDENGHTVIYDGGELPAPKN